MPDLSVDFCGVRLRNPIVAAPAGVTETSDRLKRCEDAGCGAAVIKSYFEYEPARHSPTPRFRVLDHQMGSQRSFTLYSYEQANVYGLDEFGEQIRRATESCEMPIFSSINCTSPERWAEAAQVSAQSGARAIELNASCPHGTHLMAGSAMLQTMLGAMEAARSGAQGVPLVPKVTGQLEDPAATVRALAGAGADGVIMFNRFTGLDIDLDAERPVMHGGYAGHGGPWALQYLLRWLAQTSPGLTIPIAASGGVVDGDGAVKAILAGATVAQVCTAIVMGGYEAVGPIISGLEEWMGSKGHERLEDFRGAVCGRVVTNDAVRREQLCVARVDEAECSECGVCGRVCIYGAVTEGGVPAVDVAACVGCGLCVEMCPAGAMDMVELDEPRGFVLGVK